MADDVFSLRNQRALFVPPIAARKGEIVPGFSLRTGGRSKPPWASLNLGLHVSDMDTDVIANRELLAGDLGLPLERWIFAEQVHGTEIATVSAAQCGFGARTLATVIKGVDGLITRAPNICLALCFADCVPIYFYVTDPAAVAILHAGWRGTVGEGARKMVERLARELRLSSMAQIHVIIGPAIGKTDYEVDDQIIQRVRQLKPFIWRDAVVPRENGHYLLDLKALNRAVLIDAGIPEHNIAGTGYTTFRHPDLFFSHRRDHGSTGRMLGFIGRLTEGEHQS
ncbi:MAG: peptidoglycan editing factor PgeF [Sporolactobacillus sp.]